MVLTEGDRTKMAAARTLIAEKRYSEARALLVGIPDPKATDWIVRIDQITGQSTTPDASKRTLYGGLSLIAFVIFVIALLGAVSGGDAYYGKAAAGIVAIFALLIAYSSNRAAKRYKG